MAICYMLDLTIQCLDQNSRPLEIEDRANLARLINK